jgi:Na+/H+ antiporter NhaD/arsenite permease-like protein
MTIEQMETEIASLRETVSAMQRKDEARQKDWRIYKFAAVFGGLLYVAGSMAFLIWGRLLSEKMPLLSSMQYSLLYAAIPMILLANVLKEPVPKRP